MKRFLDSLYKKVPQYAILHSWQGLPEYLPSDLDIVITSRDLPQLERVLIETDGARPVNLLQHESTCFYFILAKRKNNEQIRFVPLDVALDYRRNGRVWFSAEELLEGRRRWKDFWIAAPDVEFKYMVVKKILKQSLPIPARARLQELVKELGPIAGHTLQNLVGEHWGSQVLSWIRDGDWKDLENHLPTLKKILKWEKLKKDPLNPLRYWLPEAKRIWRRWRYPTGLWVVVLGPDGAGKSTLIRHLQEELKRAFRRATVFHLLPGVLRQRPKMSPVSDPHGKPPYPRWISFLKLVYYVLEYNLGYLFKIRPALVRSTLILFDRYYDDLLMDPKRYRYGGPLKPAKWLRRFIPRPDVFLVLDVPVEKLLERKQEVPPEELQRQTKAYRRFALFTPNAFLIDGSLIPQEVVCQARDLLLDLLHERYLARRPIWFRRDPVDTLDWVSHALGIEVTPARTPSHAYLHLPDGRGFLLPAANTKVFRTSLGLYPAQGWKGRALKTFLSTVPQFGMKVPRLRRVRLEEREDSVFQTLREVFERKDLVFAISLGTPGPHRKPVVQVLTLDGEVLGYVKVGWNEATKSLVKYEAQVLRSLADERLPFRVPQVLYYEEVQGRTLCVQAPPPKQAQPAPKHLEEGYLGVLAALAARNSQWLPLEASVFWKRLEERKQRIQSVYWRRFLERAMEQALEDWKGHEVPFHFAHGDFAPWNAFQVDGTIYLYDWEYTFEEAPAGYDLFHFLVQVALLVDHKDVTDAIRIVIDEARGYYVRGKKQGEAKKLFRLYLLDRLSFYISCQIESPPPSGWSTIFCNNIVYCWKSFLVNFRGSEEQQ